MPRRVLSSLPIIVLWLASVASIGSGLAQSVTVRPNFPRTNNTVKALAIDPVRNIAYLGGDFTQVGGVDRLRLAAVDLASGAVLPWAPIPNGTVETIAVDGDFIYVGGRFGAVSGSVRQRIARIHLDGTVDVGWNVRVRTAAFPLDPSLDEATVTSIAVTSTNLFVAGRFSEVQSLTGNGGTAARNRLAAFTKNDGSVRSWNPNPNNEIREIVTRGSTLFVLGKFSSIAGGDGVPLARRGFAEFNSSVTLQPLNPQATRVFGTVNVGFEAIALRGEDTIFLGGEFSRIGADNRWAVAAFDANGALLPFDPGGDISPFLAFSMTATSDVLYVFDYYGRTTDGFSYYLQALGPDGARLDWRPLIPRNSGIEEALEEVGVPLVYRMIPHGNWLYLAGAFTLVSGVFQPGFAAISLASTASAIAPVSPPTLRAKGKTKLTTSRKKVTLRGTATEATLVEFKAGKGGFKRAMGSPSSWKIPVKLESGRTTVKVLATGSGGKSKILKFKIRKS